ncbi:homoserine dehydrogenase [Aristophania vespae]|uniref:Homoserine dehydrogenase n=1 Tax=Aristophania vespae TaxID=2697033 RepID=A0A6P1NHX0_9PROT|nr:homoserine dehydrogenase [Aristophania vespae]QHI96124.1 homoserine dehydrogenase [Aristophania vespae]UMM63901.1 Homoserine dehydrogenase [Aristophania vespae]
MKAAPHFSDKTANSNSLRLAIAGLGTVGCGVIKLLQEQASSLTDRTGKQLVVTAVSARDRTKDRQIDLSSFRWYDNPVELASDETIDCVLELIGGAEGPARDLVEASLKAGKAVITANKALIALHGKELAQLSKTHNAPLYYEASVAGAIPAVKIVREGLAGDIIKTIGGILNGTCNYILTTMEETGQSFEAVLKEAQEKGFAEAEPSTDIDGWDTAHKLAILANIAFKPLQFDSLTVEGIRSITASDLGFARKLGYKVKLLGMARQHQDGSIEAWVRPCLVPEKAKLAQVDNVFNALTWEGNYSGPMTISGRGAGEGPTASAVLADIIDYAQGMRLPLWGRIVEQEETAARSVASLKSAFYVRLLVDDTPGVMADISAVLRDQGISVHLIAQHEFKLEQVYLTVITHPVANSHITDAAARLRELNSVHGAPLIVTIESLC